MSPENQRIAIATACGWTAEQDSNGYWRATNQKSGHASELWLSERNVWSVGIPDYLNDLNAMHEAEQVLDYEQCEAFSNTVADIVHAANREKDYAFPWSFARIHATAPQRCEAFLRTLGLWEDEVNTTESASSTSPATEDSSAVQPFPIDSAPKYTRTLVYCHRPQVNTGWWQIAEYDEEIGEWLDDAVDGEICLVKPTCWLPLPPAPTQPQPQ